MKPHLVRCISKPWISVITTGCITVHRVGHENVSLVLMWRHVKHQSYPRQRTNWTFWCMDQSAISRNNPRWLILTLTLTLSRGPILDNAERSSFYVISYKRVKMERSFWPSLYVVRLLQSQTTAIYRNLKDQKACKCRTSFCLDMLFSPYNGLKWQHSFHITLYIK